MPFKHWLCEFLGLAYQFLGKRLFLHMPKLNRRILIALCSLVMVSVPVLVVTAVITENGYNAHWHP